MSQLAITEFEDLERHDPQIAELYEKVSCFQKSRESLELIPEYLGRGRDKVAFRAGEYVLKIQNCRPETSFALQVRPLRLLMGIKGVEQVVAVSHRERVIVTSFIDGSMPAKLSANTLQQEFINESAVANFAATLEEMRERRTWVEGPKNILVNHYGFNVIDPTDSFVVDSVNDIEGAANIISDYGWNNEIDDLFLREPKDRQRLRQAFGGVGVQFF